MDEKKHDECMKLYYGSSLGEDIDHVVFENIFDAGVDYGMQSAHEEIERLKLIGEKMKGLLMESYAGLEKDFHVSLIKDIKNMIKVWEEIK